MLAKNFMYDVDRILPSFQGRPFCMDIKIDGERMLCHREGDKVISTRAAVGAECIVGKDVISLVVLLLEAAACKWSICP